MFHKSGVEIWSRGKFVTFRRRVVRVWAQTACRASSQSGKHYLWKLNCLWKDANRWTSSRHCVPVTHLRVHSEMLLLHMFQETWKMKAWISRGVGYYTVFPPKGQLFSGCPSRRLYRQHCGPGEGSGKEHERGRKRAGHNFWKNDIAQGHSINWLKSNGSKMASQIQLNLDPQSASSTPVFLPGESQG